MNDDEIGRALNRIAAILQIAHRDAIEAERNALMEDKANKAIFKATASWAATADIEKAVVGSKAASRSTLFLRLADLTDRGLLERRKTSNTTEYRNSGLV
jgi:hypothetical protein